MSGSISVTRLTLFGGVVVDTGAGPITGRAAQRHRIALLALLSTTRRLYRSRDQLIELLWPDADPERGRRLLSDSIYRVNQALGGEALMGTGDDVRLNRTDVGSDVGDFEAAVDARDWRQAVELHAGPFLDGFYLPGAPSFDQWMEGERAQYARMVARALEALAVEARDAGRTAAAVEWWQRLAALVPDDSRVAMELMRALETGGNRAGALRHARVHALLLRETLGMEPDQLVQELAGQIAGRRDATVTAAVPAAPDIPAHTNAPGNASGHLPGRVVVATPPAASAVPGRSVAVLPFSNLSDSDANAYFADGISEELMCLLTRSPGLRVASRTSTLAYRDAGLDVREVARRLQVDWILEGSVRRAGNTLRIVVQLTDPGNGYQVWSESFDRTASDIFATQEEIAVAIVSRLESSVEGSERASAAPGTSWTSDPDTYDLHLQARSQWHRRTEVSLRRSAALIEQVVARHPGYAPAWAGLADIHAEQAFYDYLPPQVAFPRAEVAARQAMRLDPALAAPHATLAYVDTCYHWNWESAEQGFRHAIELERTNSTARQWHATLLVARGRFDEAELEMRRAAELDPLSMIALSSIGWVFMLANQGDRAIQQFERALQLDASFQMAYYWLGQALTQKGQPSEAIASLERIREPSQGCPQVLEALARAHATAGNVDTARAMLDALLERERAGRYLSSYEVAKVYQALGDVPAALTRLERAYTDRAHSMALLNVDPQLRPLAAEPRFRTLVERMNLAPGGGSPNGEAMV